MYENSNIEIDHNGQPIELPAIPTEEAVSPGDETRKIIQLILDDEGMPMIQYANVNASEVLGALSIAQAIFKQKKVVLPSVKASIMI